ncbi:MAG: phosphoribosylformylglycinamidine synthase I [Candidatus Aenigmarchaeota archaeon]|nr:phosphoribosylformylglycinamidine synthase I [Candidatus Aenigmarchaeota archaeon]
MEKNKIKVCVLREPGTNCDRETNYIFNKLGANSRVIHLNKFLSKEEKLNDFHILVFPGGFSNSDHIRSGVVFAKKLMKELSADVEEFVNAKKPIIGICNGFQILVEAGLLPGIDGISKTQQAALATNEKLTFESRSVNLINASRGKCIFAKGIPYDRTLKMPIAHGEGNFKISQELLMKLIENDQIVFIYGDDKARPANGKYPFNPNGSVYDIAGICNSTGTILGMMPHPERASDESVGSTSGLAIFENAVKYVEEEF